jgi:flagellar motility protein MotE (MotC chaperone)
MVRSIRYTIEHVGDIVIGPIEAVVCWLGGSTKGISLTYDIRNLERKKKKSYIKIGKKTAELRKQNPSNELFSDEDMSQLFSELDNMEEDLNDCTRKREERLKSCCSEVSEDPA